MSVLSNVRQLGWLDALLYLGGQVLSRLSGGRARVVKYRLVAQPIGRAEAKPLRPDAATELRAVPAGDALVKAFERPPYVLARRYADGAACTAALVRGEFAGFIWIQRGAYDEDEVRCRYELLEPASCVWDFDVYVVPRYRVGRTLARLWSHVDQALAREGVRWSFSRISAFNRDSLAAHARLGTVDCGSALFVVLGPLQLALLPGPPWLHVSLRRAPRIRLAAPKR
jgi:hypothetical protein